MDLARFLLLDSIERLDLATGEIVGAAVAPPPEASLFEGHFPGAPLFPGVLQIEVMAQAAGVLLMAAHGGARMPFLVGVDQARLRRPAPPGARLRAGARIAYQGDRMAELDCRLEADEMLAATARLRLSLAVPPNETAARHVRTLLDRLGVSRSAVGGTGGDGDRTWTTAAR